MPEPAARVKLVLVGSAGVGKTCLIRRWVHGQFDTTTPTIGMDFVGKTICIDGVDVCFNVWDTAGAEEFRALTRHFIRGSSGVGVIFSVTDRDSYDAAREWYESVAAALAGNPCQFAIAGNKCDLTASRVVETGDAVELAAEFGAEYVECSAKTGEGVDRLFVDLARGAYQAYVRQQERLPTVKLGEPASQPGGCC